MSQSNKIVVGDTLNSLSLYSYQYAGIARGEYPIWNPLVRAGQPEEEYQCLQSASPISNIVIVLSILFGIEDITFSFSIYVLVHILLFIIGVYLIVSCWTNNFYAGVFASILAIGSSSVFYSPYHLGFVLILHAVPWMLYAVSMYFRDFKFRYLMVFALAYCSALHSYEIVMGLSYIITVGIAATIIFNKKITNKIFVLRKIPAWHIFTLAGFLIFITAPALAMFFSFKGKLAISRITDIHINDNYLIIYREAFARITQFPLFSIKFWTTFFTGFFFGSFEELRHYVGPIALPFFVVSLISFRKASWCIAVSGVLLLMLAGNIFPMRLLFRLPLFGHIRNGHFLLQFLILVTIILAGFGWDSFFKNGAKKIWGAACGFMIISSISVLLLKRNLTFHNTVALITTIVSMVVLLLSMKYMLKKQFIVIIFIVAIAVVFVFTIMTERLPMTGGINDNKELLALRKRSNHSLLFLNERPLKINKVILPDVYYTTLGTDESWSYITLRDNSFKTSGKAFGHSSFPLLKNYHLFMSVPGHEQMMRKKFFFFRKCYTSTEPADMMAFRRDPKLLATMLTNGVGVVDQLNAADISLGPFQPESIKNISVETRKTLFKAKVKVVEYKANRIRLTVLVGQSGLFAYTDLWDKGWQVKLDGRLVPLRKVFHTFKGVELTPGKHEIEFLYKNKAIVLIILMNICFIICSLGLVIYLLRIAFILHPYCNFSL